MEVASSSLLFLLSFSSSHPGFDPFPSRHRLPDFETPGSILGTLKVYYVKKREKTQQNLFRPESPSQSDISRKSRTYLEARSFKLIYVEILRYSLHPHQKTQIHPSIHPLIPPPRSLNPTSSNSPLPPSPHSSPTPSFSPASPPPHYPPLHPPHH